MKRSGTLHERRNLADKLARFSTFLSLAGLVAFTNVLFWAAITGLWPVVLLSPLAYAINGILAFILLGWSLLLEVKVDSGKGVRMRIIKLTPVILVNSVSIIVLILWLVGSSPREIAIAF